MGTYFSKSAPRNAKLEELASPKEIPYHDKFWSELLEGPTPVSVDETTEEVAQEYMHKLCAQFAANNETTCNFQQLVGHTVSRLELCCGETPSAEALSHARNAVFLVRVFCQHLVQTCDEATLTRHFEGQAFSGQDDELILSSRLVEVLVAVLGSEPVADVAGVHEEALGLLLTLLSTQMHAPLPEGGARHVFMRLLMALPSPRTTRLFHALLHYITTDRGVPVSAQQGAQGDAADDDEPSLLGTVTHTVTSTASTLVMLPVHLKEYFFPHAPTAHPLGQRSLGLLLVLLCTRPQHAHNPFLTLLRALCDVGVGDAEGGRGGAVVSFSALYDALGFWCDTNPGVLLLYMLLISNTLFHDFVLARTDHEVLLVPLVRRLYYCSTLRANELYILLVIVLIFTQDASLNANMHTHDVEHVAWYRERILAHISLGSLLVTVLVRTVSHALTKLKDSYLLSNCLACLCNMAPHFQRLHEYACHRLVGLFSMLSRRYTKLHRVLYPATAEERRASSDPTFSMEHLQGEMGTFQEFVRMVLVVFNSALAHALPRNPNLVYALLRQRHLLDAFRGHATFGDVVANVDLVVDEVRQRLAIAKSEKGAVVDVERVDDEGDAAGTGGTDEWSVEEVMGVIEQEGRTWSADRMRVVDDLKYRYEETSNSISDDFFVPLAWALCHRAKLLGTRRNVVLFDTTPLDTSGKGGAGTK